jgi:hypothetical protein
LFVFSTGWGGNYADQTRSLHTCQSLLFLSWKNVFDKIKGFFLIILLIIFIC